MRLFIVYEMTFKGY